MTSQLGVTSPADTRTAAAPEMAAGLDLPAGMVLSSELKSPDFQAAQLLNAFGSIIKPRKGASMVVLSTGRIKGSTLPEPGTDFGKAGIEDDVVTLTLKINVPIGANRMSFDYNFLSAESPEYIKTEYNDVFTAKVSDAFGAARTVATASVNSVTFFDASMTYAQGTGFDLLVADHPEGIDQFPGDYPIGIKLFPDAGLTGFQTVNVEVASGQELTLEFDIRDSGDGFMDSTVVLDNIVFSVIQAVDPNPLLLNPDTGQIIETAGQLARSGTNVSGVVADGAAQVLLRVNVPSLGDVVFSVVGDDVNVYGGLGAVGSESSNDAAWKNSLQVTAQNVAGQYFAFVAYRSPKNFNNAVEGVGGVGDFAGDYTRAKSRPVSIIATYTPSTGVGFNGFIDLEIHRPPVVVLHNIWSSCMYWDGNAFIYAKDAVGRELFEVTCADYSSNNALSIDAVENKNVVSAAVFSALKKMRTRGIAASQVDILAHGAGGLMARYFAKAGTYSKPDNYMMGAFNRLITLNTPHLGTPIAIEVGATRDSLMAGKLVTWLLVKGRLAEVGIVIDGDALIDDLGTSSAFLSTLGPTRVPSHAMVSVGGERLNWDESWALLSAGIQQLYTQVQIYSPKATSRPDKTLVLGQDSKFFGGNRHDLFVTEASQKGGLVSQAVSEFKVVVGDLSTEHFQTPASPLQYNRFVELLNSPVDGRFFAPSLPAPSSLAKPRVPVMARGGPSWDEPSASKAGLGWFDGPQALPKPGLKITAPFPNTEVSPGGFVRVAVETLNGFQPFEVSVLGAKNALSFESTPFEGSFKIPADAIGTISLVAYGTDKDGQVQVSEPVPLKVKVSAELDAIRVINGDAFLQGPLSTLQLSVLGIYSDRIIRDIASSAVGTVYSSSNTSVFTVSPDGRLTGTGPGIATLTLRNGTIFTSITVTVGNGSDEGGGGNEEPCIQVRLGDYNLFVLQDFLQGHYVQGRVAAGGNIVLSDFSVGRSLPDTDISNALVARGDISLSRGGVWGDVRYAGRFSADDSVNLQRGTVAQGTPVNFDARGNELNALSSKLSALAVNGTVELAWGAVVLKGTSTDVNVFDLQGSVIPGSSLLRIEAPAGSLAVINVRGTSVSFSNLGQDLAGGLNAQNVLFNFPEATSLSTSKFSFQGTVLAPKAHVSFKEGVWEGGLYAKSLTGEQASGHLNPLQDRNICQ